MQTPIHLPQKSVRLLLFVATLTAMLVSLNLFIPENEIWTGMSSLISKQLIYQGISLALAFSFLLVLSVSWPEAFKTYFKKGNLNAKVVPAPAIGIKPKHGQNWKHYGWNFTLVISLITAVVIYLSTPEINGEMLLRYLPFTIAFALINSFVEEAITRLGVIVSLKGHLPDQYIAFVSAGIFGIAHYWGTPGGIGGVVLAGFLGWLLAKSILETKGIFWAWLIHFIQDIIIITALFNTN